MFHVLQWLIFMEEGVKQRHGPGQSWKSSLLGCLLVPGGMTGKWEQEKDGILMTFRNIHQSGSGVM